MAEIKYEALQPNEIPQNITLPAWLGSFQMVCDSYELQAAAALENDDFKEHDRQLTLRAKEIEGLARTLKVFQEQGILDVPREIMDLAIEYAEEARLHLENDDLFGIVSLLLPDYQDGEPDEGVKPFEALAIQAQELDENLT